MPKLFSLTSVCCLVAVSLTSFAVQAEMYRYIDEDGQVVYSQFRPAPGVEATTVGAPPPPPSSAGETRQELFDSMQRRIDEKQDQANAEEEAAAKEAEELRRQKNCNAARYNLENLTAQDNRILLDRDGKEMTLSDSQRKKAIQKARDEMARDCK